MNSLSKNKTIKNIIILNGRMIFVLLISVFTTRVLLQEIGIYDYGVFVFLTGFITLIGFFLSSIGASAQRFLSFSRGNEIYGCLGDVFYTISIAYLIVVAFVFILLETLGLYLFDFYLQYNKSQIIVSNTLYHICVFSFLLNVLTIPFSSLLISCECIYKYSYINILDSVLKLISACVLILFDSDKLLLYTLIIMFFNFVILFSYILVSISLLNKFKFLNSFSLIVAKKFINFSSWNLLGSLSAALSGSGVNLILNFYFGPTVNAARSIAIQCNSAVSSLVLSAQGAINPLIIRTYASNQLEKSLKLVFQTTKYNFLFFILFAIPIFINSKTVLDLWLVDYPLYAPLFLQLTILSSLIDMLSSPISTYFQANGRIKFYQILISGILISSIPISVFIIYYYEEPSAPLYVTLLVAIFAQIARCILARIYFEFPTFYYIKNVIYPLFRTLFLMFVFIYFIFYFLELLFIEEHEMLRILQLLISFIVSLFVTVFFGFTKMQRIELKKIISSFCYNFNAD